MYRIDFGYPSNNDKIPNGSLLDLKKVEGNMVREYEKELFEIGEVEVVLVGGREGEDDIENLKRSERFRSEDVIEMKKNDVHV
ncbi:hypothetical protein Tco_0962563 [Tanacetum coccineum]